MTIRETIKEVSPTTIKKCEKLANLLQEAQALASELIVNDTLKVLKIEGTNLDTNLDYQIMTLKHMVRNYKKSIEKA